jgi:hypothetical protein
MKEHVLYLITIIILSFLIIGQQFQIESLHTDCRDWEKAFVQLNEANKSLKVSFDKMVNNFNRCMQIKSY